MESLGDGSIVLSAQRFKEMVEKIAILEKNAFRDEFIFSECKIKGRVVSSKGRELLEVQLEYTYQTEKPDTLLPIPLKGLRLSQARMDGDVPDWRILGDQLAIHVAKPKRGKLVLETILSVQSTNIGKKVLLDRIPSAALTRLDLEISDKIIAAIVNENIILKTEHHSARATRLYSDSLGLITHLDIAWELETDRIDKRPNSRQITSTHRLTPHDKMIEVEESLKLPHQILTEPFLKLRLPLDATEVRGEWLSVEGKVLEPSKLTKEKETWLLATPEPILVGKDQPLFLSLRWYQPKNDITGSTRWSPAWIINRVESQQSGILQVILTRDNPLRLTPRNLIRMADEGVSVLDRGKVLRYGFASSTPSIEFTFLDHDSRPCIEASWSFTTQVFEDYTRLVSDLTLENMKPGRPHLLKIHWPDEWKLQKDLLLSSEGIADVEQKTGNELIIQLLETDRTTPFRIRLESHQPRNQMKHGCDINLPRLLSAERRSVESTVRMQLVEPASHIHFQAENTDLVFDETTSGIRNKQDQDVAGHSIPHQKTTAYTISDLATAKVSILTRPIMGRFASQVDVFVAPWTMTCLQTIRLQYRPGSIQFFDFKVVKQTEVYAKIRSRKQAWQATAVSQGTESNSRRIMLPLDSDGDVEFIFSIQSAIEQRSERLQIPLVEPALGTWEQQAPSVMRVHCDNQWSIQPETGSESKTPDNGEFVIKDISVPIFVRVNPSIQPSTQTVDRLIHRFIATQKSYSCEIRIRSLSTTRLEIQVPEAWRHSPAPEIRFHPSFTLKRLKWVDGTNLQEIHLPEEWLGSSVDIQLNFDSIPTESDVRWQGVMLPGTSLIHSEWFIETSGDRLLAYCNADPRGQLSWWKQNFPTTVTDEKGTHVGFSLWSSNAIESLTLVAFPRWPSLGIASAAVLFFCWIPISPMGKLRIISILILTLFLLLLISPVSMLLLLYCMMPALFVITLHLFWYSSTRPNRSLVQSTFLRPSLIREERSSMTANRLSSLSNDAPTVIRS